MRFLNIQTTNVRQMIMRPADKRMITIMRPLVLASI